MHQQEPTNLSRNQVEMLTLFDVTVDGSSSSLVRSCSSTEAAVPSK